MITFIAEDEPLAAQKLQLFLQKLGQRAEDIRIFANGEELISTLQQGQLPDVLFLDIQMPGLTGLDVLERMQSQPGYKIPHVIITSAYDRYAIDGFNFGVTDYLLKPYTLDRLRQALAKTKLETATIDVRVGGRIERIPIDEIVCLQADRDYTLITLADQRRLTTLGTLSSVEQLLPTAQFARIQRSYTVSLSHIRSYSAQSVILSTGDEIPIGRTYRDAFSQLMKL